MPPSSYEIFASSKAIASPLASSILVGLVLIVVYQQSFQAVSIIYQDNKLIQNLRGKLAFVFNHIHVLYRFGSAPISPGFISN